MSQASCRAGDLHDLQKGAFDGLWDLVEEARMAQVAALRRRADALEAMSREDYFAAEGVYLPKDLCTRVLGLWTLDGACATWAVQYGTPWKIRLDYHDGRHSIERHCSLGWELL